MPTLRRILHAHAWALALVLAVLLLARVVAHDAAWPLLVANQFSVHLYAPIWIVLVGALAVRRWPLAAVSLPVALWHLALVVPPWLPRTPPPACGPALSVLSANLLMVHPAPNALAEEIFAADADVVLLQELSPAWHAVLDARGLFDGWPEGWQVVREDSFGSAILSRLPLDTTGEIEVTGLPQTRATITWEGRAIELLNVHTLPPRTAEYTALHRQALDHVATQLRTWAASGVSFILGGDLNASPYSRFFADIDGVGDDAWDLAGQGFGFTWPNGVFPLPSARLDHVIVSRDLTVTSIRVGTGAGSDHRPLRVEVSERCR
ncbi:MAG: endonuclease/exonuclease/phosphatase family protein [Myxococcota bacterium]